MIEDDDLTAERHVAEIARGLHAPLERRKFFVDRDAAADGRDATAARDDYSADQHDVQRAQDDAAAGADSGGRSDVVNLNTLDRLRAADGRRRAADDRSSARMDRIAAAMDRSLSSLDDLTGAYRRDAGFHRLVDDLETAQRRDQIMTLAFVDIDGLKAVNDTRGHGFGDALLKHVVDAVVSTMRSSDPVVRYGGDEFLIGAIGMTSSEVRIRLTAAESAVRLTHGASFTSGVATSRPGEALTQLIDRADQYLYRNRNSD